MVSIALAYAIRREGPEEFSHKISCVLLRELAFSLGNDWASEIFGEGMLIIGWVAMWRPLEIFLYEWVPIRRRCKIFAKLAEMKVIVQTKPVQRP
jgi:hypothetical protein